MSSSATPGSPSAACTQFLRRRHWPCDALVRVSALPTPPALRFSPGKPISGLHYSSLSLQPADLLASLVGADQRLPSSQPRLLLPGFQRLDRSHRCRIWLRCGNWASSTDDRGRDTGRPVRRVGPGSFTPRRFRSGLPPGLRRESSEVARGARRLLEEISPESS